MIGWKDKPINSTKLHRNRIKSIVNTYWCLFSRQSDVTSWMILTFKGQDLVETKTKLIGN